jgi:hypothetical protein
VVLEAQEPDGPRRDEIEAILSSLPDLREVYDEAEAESMMEVFDAYDSRSPTTNRPGHSSSASCSAVILPAPSHPTIRCDCPKIGRTYLS